MPPTHPNLANSYHKTASIYQALNDLDSALVYMLRSVKIREVSLSANHPDVGISYATLATIYKGQKEFQKALEAQQKSYDILKDQLPPNHPNSRILRSNFGILYKEIGEYEKSEGRSIEAIQNFQKALEFTTDSAAIFNQIGLAYYALKDYSNANNYYEKSYQLDSTNVRGYLHNKALAYAKSGNRIEAKACLENLEKRFPKDSLVYRTWAVYYALLGDVDSAISHLEEATELDSNSLDWIQTEESVEILRNEDRYKAIIAKLTAKE